MTNVFLGGTCADSKWRDELLKHLSSDISAYNPVVPNWTPECQVEEIRQRETCDYCLYFLTPESPNTYSIAEAVDDSNKRPGKTLFCFQQTDKAKFEPHQLKALNQIGKMVAGNGAKWLENSEEVASFLNGAAASWESRK